MILTVTGLQEWAIKLDSMIAGMWLDIIRSYESSWYADVSLDGLSRIKSASGGEVEINMRLYGLEL